MFYRIEVREKAGFFDAAGAAVKKDIEALGFKGRIKSVKTAQVYLIQGGLDTSAIKRVCEELLIDPITQIYDYKGSFRDGPGVKAVEIAYNPGVMDPVEESLKKAIGDLGIKDVEAVRTAKRYLINGNLSLSQIRRVAEKVLYNKVIQHLVTGESAIHPEVPPYKFDLKTVDLVNAGPDRLKKISKDGQLFLSLEEMKTIKGYFKKLGRNPTDCELETIAQTWSEHCKHKTFRGRIEYSGEITNHKLQITNKPQITNSKKILINNLLKETVMKVTKELKKPWCISVFKDNSGIIRFDDDNDICFKVETHNHPSALEPYGGAGTGIGGVIRDPMGTGLGAKPIINTDIFCFGPMDYPYNKLPKGALHPRRVMKGVVSGVRDYGNRMGIPTSNGAVCFDKDFVGNPLVFCGNVGIMPKNKAEKKVSPQDLIVVVGGRTGRDGIHGATFSSGELTHESEEVSGSAVQIGNPIQEKKVADTILQARDRGLYNSITDCGAGGLSSAVGEMGEELGAEVYLEKVPLKYKGLSYSEIWISEAQERMVLAVDPKNIDDLIKVFASENVEATVIGKFTGDGRLRLFYDGNKVCDMSMKFIHDGGPAVTRIAKWKKPLFKEPRANRRKNLTPDLLRLLASPNIASKEWIIRQYDHEVQAGSIIKPLQGIDGGGPGDASVTRPVFGSKKGIALSCGINPDYGKIDPYWMAAGAIDEALRQIISVGGNLSRCAILDNFCWGNTNKPDRLGGLVRASQACYDIAKAYGVPFISGKDSLNNEYSTGKKTISIPPTLLISCIAVIDDISKCITMDIKSSGNPLYMVGLTHDEMGGSKYYKMKGYTGNGVPKVDAAYGRSLMENLSRTIEKRLVRSCHDCSEGGMAVTLAEMAFSGGIGADIDLARWAPPAGQPLLIAEKLLFSESNTRFIVEVSDEARFLRSMSGFPVWRIGTTVKDKHLVIRDITKKTVVKADIDGLKAAWKGTFGNF